MLQHLDRCHPARSCAGGGGGRSGGRGARWSAAAAPTRCLHAAPPRRRWRRRPAQAAAAAAAEGPTPKAQLGRGGLTVPRVCFGTMLFGESTPAPAATRLVGACLEAGVNFFDCAEMYPVPQREATAGRSEELLAAALRGRARDSYILATKAAGPSGQMTWIRGGPPSLDAANIAAAIDGSLRRLGTDFIDLYQIHWPDRYVPMFGDVDFDPANAYQSVPLEEQLEALSRAVEAGKVRHVGVSNETPWGLMRWLRLADDSPGLPRVTAIQNAYSLLCRTFDSGLAEVCHEEGVGLLAYSPLAMGLLTGKYLPPDGGPPMARLNRYKGRYAEAESRYGPRPPVVEAVRAYCAIAARHGMAPTELALRFVLGRPLVASAVIGATSEAQLSEQLAAARAPPLGAGVLSEVEEVHRRLPNPTP